MILLVSSAKDSSIKALMDWLDLLNRKYFLLNVELLLCEKFTLDVQNRELVCNEITLNLNEVKVLWLRKYNNAPLFRGVEHNFHDYLNEEIQTLLHGIISLANPGFVIGNFDDKVYNKLYQLSIAMQAGFSTPWSVVSNNQIQLEKSKAYSLDLITKPLSETSDFEINGFEYRNYTSMLSKGEIPDSFFPSLIQEKVEYAYELRVFFFIDTFFTSLLLNQKEYIDTRRNRNNKYLPFELPPKQEEKLRDFFKRMELNTGSVDLLVTTSREWFFLEVNPSGIYDGYGKDCNYQLDHFIANKISSICDEK